LPGAVPGKPVGQPFQLRRKFALQRPPHERAGAVGTDEQIAVLNLIERRDNPVIFHLYSRLGAQFLEKLVEFQATDGRKSIAVDIDDQIVDGSHHLLQLSEPFVELVAAHAVVVVTEPQPRPLWQRVATRLAGRQWRAALLQLPRWPTTLLLALPFAVWVTLSLSNGQFLPWPGRDLFALHPVALVLLMGRDCALALFLAFSLTGRRPVMGFVVLMAVLHGLLPWLFGLAHNDVLLGLVQPLLATGPLSLVFAAAHLVMALGLLRWRWRATAPD